MKNARIVWLPEALADIERLYGFLKEKSPAAAKRAAQVILQGACILEETPEAGRPMQDDTGRREFFVAFGIGAYVLRYKRNRNTVVVIRVWHSKEQRD